MATIKSRLLVLEARNKNQKKLALDLTIKAEIQANLPMVRAYFESNGCKLDTQPRDDFTDSQRMILESLIAFEREY